MADKVPQSTAVLVKRLRRVAKALDIEAGYPALAAHIAVSVAGRALHEKNAATWRARANTCLQSAGRLEELDAKRAEAESYVAHLEEHGNL